MDDRPANRIALFYEPVKRNHRPLNAEVTARPDYARLLSGNNMNLIEISVFSNQAFSYSTCFG